MGRRFLRARPPLALASLLIFALVLLSFNAIDWMSFMARSPGGTDFALYWIAFRVGMVHGWSSIYDPSIYLPALAASTGRWFPYLNPPVLLWLLAPILVLPYRVAFALWSGVLAGCWLVSWRIAAPGSGALKLAHLIAGAAVYIFFMGFRLGQVTMLVMLGVALCWWLMTRQRETLAGVALALLVLKPQLAFLVPLTLLAAGYWRVVISFLVVALPLLLLSLLALGSQGVANFVRASTLAHAMVASDQVTVLAVTRSPLLAVIVGVLVAGMAIACTRLRRARGPELPVAAGLLGSLLAAPYLNGFDLAALLLAAWLVLRLNPPRWIWLLIVAGYLDVAFFVITGTIPTLLVEAALLGSLSLIGSGAAANQAELARAA